MRSYSALDSAVIRLGSFLTSRARSGSALAILMFHRVLPRKDPLLASEPDAATFSALMELVSGHFNVLPLSDAMVRLKARKLPPRAVCITFDDGYANNHAVALPILSARRIPATVFVASGFLDGGRMFNDTIIESVRRAPASLDLRDIGLGSYRLTDDSTRARAAEEIIGALKHRDPSERSRATDTIASRVGLPEHSDLMMTRDQVRELHRAGIEIGAHTITHPILTALGAEEARREISASKSELEAIIGAPVTTFAYPNGKPGADYAGAHVSMVSEAGFEAAFSTAWGSADIGSDVLQMPRIAPWGKSPSRYALQIAESFRPRRYAQV